MHVYLLSKIFLKFKKTWQKKLGKKNLAELITQVGKCQIECCVKAPQVPYYQV